MFWNQLIKTCLVSLMAFGCLLSARPLINSASAQFFYYEDFSSGESSLDPWNVSLGSANTDEDGLKLIVTTKSDSSHPDGLGTGARMNLADLAGAQDLEDVSIRMQFGIDTTPAANRRENFVGIYVEDQRGVLLGGVDANNGWLGVLTTDPFRELQSARIPPEIDLFGGDEIILQFDIQDNIELYAWKPGTAMPNTPNVTAALPRDYLPGDIGLNIDFNKAQGVVSIRNVTVAQESIPEPGGLALAGVASLLLLADRRRTIRFR